MSATHELLLTALADPSIALLLLGAGILGVCLELSGIGRILPGVLGSACVVLALGSPAARSFDVRGAALVAGSLVCFVCEATVRTRGLLSLGGAIALLVGLFMIDRRMGWAVAAVFAMVFSALISFLLAVAFAARRNKLGILKNRQTAHS
jgi:membrane-bound serine protease (ClpP class)